MPRPALPAWLRRGLEAAIVASVVAIASLLGNGYAAGPPRDLPSGLLGATIVAPGVLAIGVLTAAYPVAMAATREDALLGAAAGFLIGADAVLLLAGGRVRLERPEIEWPVGLLVAALALLPAIAGIVASQVGTPFGFGRRAGAWAAGASAVVALVLLAALAGLG